MRVFMTVAADLVMEGIQEPVRFLIETKAKIFPATERFWYFAKRPLQEQFIIRIKEVSFLTFSKVFFLLCIQMCLCPVFRLGQIYIPGQCYDYGNPTIKSRLAL